MTVTTEMADALSYAIGKDNPKIIVRGPIESFMVGNPRYELVTKCLRSLGYVHEKDSVIGGVPHWLHSKEAIDDQYKTLSHLMLTARDELLIHQKLGLLSKDGTIVFKPEIESKLAKWLKGVKVAREQAIRNTFKSPTVQKYFDDALSRIE